MAMKGYLMQMQPFSVNDGDGIRTTIFSGRLSAALQMVRESGGTEAAPCCRLFTQGCASAAARVRWSVPRESALT